MAYTAIPSSGGGGTVADDSITDAKLRNSAGLSVIGRSANTSGDPADIVGAADQVLRVSGTTLGFGTVTGAMMSGFVNTRIPFGNSSGQLTDSASLIWSGTQLSLASASNTTQDVFTSLASGNATIQARASDAAGFGRIRAQATNTSNRIVDVLAYGPSAGSTMAGLSRNSMVAISDVGSATAPSAFLIHANGATPMSFATGDTVRLTIPAAGFAANQIFYGSSSNALAQSANWTFDGTENVTLSSNANPRLSLSSTLTTGFTSMQVNATSGSTRKIQMFAFGPTATGTIFGLTKNSMIGLGDFNSSTAPSSMTVGTAGATPLVLGTNDTEAARVLTNQQFQFASASIAANSTGTVTAPVANGPTNIAVQEWLVVRNSSGTVRYIPLYG